MKYNKVKMSEQQLQQYPSKKGASVHHHEILLVDTPMNTAYKYQDKVPGEHLNLDLPEAVIKNESQFSLPKITHKAKH